MNPLVSIIIPTYNREKYVSQAIQSAINQTYTNVEIIIGDNQSSDNTWPIICDYASRDSRIHAFQNKTNIGPVLNWSECFKHSKGEFIKIIWSDDYISLDFIEKTLSVFDKDTAFVISSIQVIDEILNSDIFLQEFNNTQYSIKQYLDDIFIWKNNNFPVSPGAALFRTRDVLNNFVVDNIPNTNNLFSKENGAGNDQLLFLNIACLYKYVRIVNDTKSFFRSHAGAFTNSDKISLFYYWGKCYFLNKHKNKIYSDILKLRLLGMCLKNKSYDQLYHSLKFTFAAPASFVIFIIYLFRKSFYEHL
jgi:glycosyltransferase involved in cell wall biosynthesis